MDLNGVKWRNGSALVFGTKGCRFESCFDRIFERDYHSTAVPAGRGVIIPCKYSPFFFC